MGILNRILIATDFSAAGHAAAARAGQLASQHGADLYMIHATPDWPLFSRSGTARQDDHEGLTRNAESLVDRETSWLRNEFRVPARADVHPGQASHTIVRAVETYQPDLVVIGASGERALKAGPTVLGGTALKLISQIAQPLLLVRDSDPTAYDISLAAVQNSSPVSRRIVHWSSALVHEGTCHIVCAYELPYSERLRLCDPSNAAIEARYEAEERSLKAEIGALPCAAEVGPQVAPHVIRGTALSVILSEISRYRPQVLVVGRHEHQLSGAAHDLIGCAGVQLAYHAPCDVLIVP